MTVTFAVRWFPVLFSDALTVIVLSPVPETALSVHHEALLLAVQVTLEEIFKDSEPPSGLKAIVDDGDKVSVALC